ncbi:MAG: TetR/AcrR family transcriptional regulator [Ruminococcus sp.]|uniref:TetR/AcrR family transcriptional regulator n=1 Tax=Ruminococcus sp. TaxID=41978 RepID=UPI001B17D4A5|nr:TetR/AcrR family transcriptional regulator [Ruminococcus sp.]MBO7472391.1 TetR/AcrR family transcriptional regulator [Ruminococcus sp.]
MPRDKTQSHERIIEAAKKEFMQYGFTDTSLRRIATEAGIQVGGLYKHFSSKEEMFASLVDPAIEGLLDCFHEIEDDYFDEIGKVTLESIWEDKMETVRFMEYIYDHFDEFKLIVCRSQGTKYENFTHDIAILEEEVTIRYMSTLKKSGLAVSEIDEKEFHLLVTSSVEAIFQTVIHDFTKDEAMHYAHTLEKFYLPAWKALFGL